VVWDIQGRRTPVKRTGKRGKVEAVFNGKRQVAALVDRIKSIPYTACAGGAAKPGGLASAAGLAFSI